MKHKTLLSFFSFLTMLLVLAQPARAGDSLIDLNRKIDNSWALYQTLQMRPETRIPDSVVARAKGVIFLDCWSGEVVFGGAAGSGIGLSKDANGKFSAPAFYSSWSVSFGLQLGGRNTKIAVFLLTDRALHALTDGKLAWSGDARVVAGGESDGVSTNDGPDVMIYTQASGLDLGAAVAANKMYLNFDANRLYYGKPDLTPSDIFEGKVEVSDEAKALVDALNKQAQPQ